VYKCSKCGKILFKSDSKFDSGTKWPSFRKALKEAIKTKPDYSLGMVRTEILCSNCKLHLGHLFNDGKVCGDPHTDAGDRYCVLSESLKFEKRI